MITGVLQINSSVGEDINLQMTDYFYSWFIIETIKSIVVSGGNYNNLTVYSDAIDLECSSDTYLDSFVEQLTEMYYACHTVIQNGITTPLPDWDDIDLNELGQNLGDLHYQTYTSLVANNSYQEFLNIVNEINNSENYNAIVNLYGTTLHYVVRGDQTANVFKSMM